MVSPSSPPLTPAAASPETQSPETHPPETQQRKADHLRVCLEEDVQCRQVTTGLERYRFVHCCLPELDRQEISLATEFLGKSLGLPLLISSMTGGTAQAHEINRRLAQVAQRHGLAMGVGSQRVAVENAQLMETFALREIAPDCLLLANLGAVQLNYGYGVRECEQAIAGLEADALILHLNPLQESVQTAGDTNFKGLLPKIADLCDRLSVPVIVKEVGNGIAPALAERLIQAGVQAIDVAGAGGTSWAKVEGERARDLRQRRLGQTFADWGIPTADCIVGIRQMAPTIPLIASGGIRTGLEVAKAIALGADLVGLAYPFLQAAAESTAALDTLVSLLQEELLTALFCTGCGDLPTLRQRCPLAPRP